jgi:hypothetical protein
MALFGGLGEVVVSGWSPATRELVAEFELRAGLAALVARVPGAGVMLSEAEVSPDGRAVALTVWSVRELSTWYDVLGFRSAGVTGRHERRGDGQLYGLGGLAWQVALPELAELPGVRVLLESESGEHEVLPDTALVRAMCPWELRLQAAAGRQVAA